MFQACGDAPCREVCGGAVVLDLCSSLHSSLCAAGMIGQNKTPEGNMANRSSFRSLSPRFLISRISLFTHAAISDNLLSSVPAHLEKPRPPSDLILIDPLDFIGLDTQIYSSVWRWIL